MSVLIYYKYCVKFVYTCCEVWSRLKRVSLPLWSVREVWVKYLCEVVMKYVKCLWSCIKCLRCGSEVTVKSVWSYCKVCVKLQHSVGEVWEKYRVTAKLNWSLWSVGELVEKWSVSEVSVKGVWSCFEEFEKLLCGVCEVAAMCRWSVSKIAVSLRTAHVAAASNFTVSSSTSRTLHLHFKCYLTHASQQLHKHLLAVIVCELSVVYVKCGWSVSEFAE